MPSVFTSGPRAARATVLSLRPILSWTGWLAFLAAVPLAASAATFYVDGSNPNATDAGSGSSEAPYRTIQAAVNARGGPGTVLSIRPATYRERVRIQVSGTETDPFVLQAEGPGVVVSGADDFSSPSSWQPVTGEVFLAPTVSWAPFQVFADGARLASSTAAAAQLGAGSFVYVPGEGLYVNAGGGNPGDHRCEVGHRRSTITLSGGDVVIDGITFTSSDDRNVEIVTGASGAIVRRCISRFAYKMGITVEGCPDVTVQENIVHDNADHGIRVTGGSTGCRIRGNESFRNARPLVRAACGIDISGTTGCVVEANRCHHNQDSGIQFYNGAHDAISRNNISWSNGDHGYDQLRSVGVRHVHDVARGNFKDGFSFEGESSGASLFDCIAVDNGLESREFNLWIDATSAPGLASDHNLFWNSTNQSPVKIGTAQYATLSALFAATGLDGHSRQADPLFVDPANGDFHLRAGSPAIDAARSDVPSWPDSDAEGRPRRDDPATPNAGAGDPPYADLGALEFVPAAPADRPPQVSVASTVMVREGRMLMLDVAASDPDGDPIGSLSADLSALPEENDASFVVNAAQTAGTLTWTPEAGDARTTPYPVTFTATNALSGSASSAISVDAASAPTGNLCGNPGFESDLRGWEPYGSATIARVAGGHGGSGCVEVRSSGSSTFGLGDYVPNWVAVVPAEDTRYRFSAWVRSDASRGNPRLYIREFLNDSKVGDTVLSPSTQLSPTWTEIAAEFTSVRSGSTIELEVKDYPARSGEVFQIDDVSIVRLTGPADRAPVVNAPATAGVTEGQKLTLNVTASDPDGDAIATLAADLSGLPAESDASFATNGAKTSGTLTWTPTSSDGRPAAYVVTFTATNAMSASSATSISVIDAAGGGNLVANGGFETDLSGWGPVGSVTLARVAGGHGGNACVEVQTTSSGTHGITDKPNVVARVEAEGIRYRITAWVRSESARGAAKIKVREFAGGMQQGSSAYSSGLTLSPSWAPIRFEYVTRMAGSFIDVEINDYPVAAGEVFQIDDVTLERVSGAALPARSAVAGERAFAFASAVTPNPFHGEAELAFTLPREGLVSVDVLDLAGRVVSRPLQGVRLSAGRHALALRSGAGAGRLPAGAYFYRLRAPDGILTGRFAALP